MERVLIIGGSGTWSGNAYIPSIKQSSDVDLVGILDPIDPYYSLKTYSHFDYLTTHDVKWIKSKRNCDEELVKRCVLELNVDLIIISTPPEFHYEYTLACLRCGLDVICDKPIIVTPGQSSSNAAALANVEKHHALMEAIKGSYNYKAARRCFVLTPLRRRVQEPYTGIYDSIRLVKENFGQDVTNVILSHNDGVFRFQDEIELRRGSHGYSDGFGKLTHTGYHILDLVASFIEYGCDIQNVWCSCKIINCNTVGDMLKSNSNKINATLLQSTSSAVDISDIALKSEMDLTISYTFYRNDEKFCNIVVDLIHCGKSNRTLNHYDLISYNDQGRTNELTIHLQQGSLFSSQLILCTTSGLGGTIGNGYTFKNYHPVIASKIQQEPVQISDFKNQSTISTVDVISNFYKLIYKGKLDGYYEYVNFSNQYLTNELYLSALIAKTVPCGEYKWTLGKI